MTSSASFISVRDVVYRYPRAADAALHNVTLDIPRGAIFGLLGPNGAGKSTLLGLLAGSLSLQRGAIEIAGEHHVERVKSMSATVPQEYAFYDALTGRENLEYFAALYDMPSARAQERIAACAERCRLTAALSQRAGEYSGGLKRRLNLAIGLLNEPSILYLDEPTVGIDAESRRDILDAIHSLRSEATIVYTSHYMEEIEQLCDIVAIIDRGQVALQAPIAELLQPAGDPTVRVRLEKVYLDLLMSGRVAASGAS